MHEQDFVRDVRIKVNSLLAFIEEFYASPFNIYSDCLHKQLKNLQQLNVFNKDI